MDSQQKLVFELFSVRQSRVGPTTVVVEPDSNECGANVERSDLTPRLGDGLDSRKLHFVNGVILVP